MAKEPRSTAKSDPSTHHLGKRIRELRQSLKLKILDLAAMTGLTSSMISQVERGGISPSIDTLKKIANALNVSVGYFFEEEAVPDAEADAVPAPDTEQGDPNNLAKPVLKSGMHIVETSPVVHEHQRKILSPGKGVNFYLLNPNLDGPIEFIYNVYEPGCGTGKGLYSHPGSECGLILDGELIVTILEKEYRLQKGDSITFDSSQPHSKRNEGSVACICVWANSPPYF